MLSRHSPRSSSSSSSDSSAFSDYLRRDAFPGHRDTLARIRFSPRAGSGSDRDESSTQAPSSYASVTCSRSQSVLDNGHGAARTTPTYRPIPRLPPSVIRMILNHLSLNDYKSLRLTCAEWLNALPAPVLPVSFRLPTEIIQQIYRYLSPIDFDAARHTCESWFHASLDGTLLISMLKEAACWTGAHADLQRQEEEIESWRQNQGLFKACDKGKWFCKEWLMSKRLATECRMSPLWRGTGSFDVPVTTDISHTRLSITDKIHFSRFQFSQKGRRTRSSSISPPVITVSGCCNFVLVVDGLVIYIYALRDVHPRARRLTSIVCPKRVLAVSMDTSFRRYAVAVLLEGRIGMCCDLLIDAESPSSPRFKGESMQLGMLTDVQGSGISSTEHRPTPAAVQLRWEEFIDSTTANGYEVRHTNIMPLADDQSSLTAETRDQAHFDATRAWLDNISEESIPPHQSVGDDMSRCDAENSPKTFYSNLGSHEDPPLSVAICPQRRCVAFGCRTGIELHWVDAFTGGDLSRWFPLASPSNHIYFLPQRRGSNLAKKLRLISSVAIPEKYGKRHSVTTAASSSSQPRRRSDGNTCLQTRQTQNLRKQIFGIISLPSENPWSAQSTPSSEGSPDHQRTMLRTVECDHYNAVPLSDGVHVMFIDPETLYLCVGSDAPLGAPTKLSRNIILLPPNCERAEEAESITAAGSDYEPPPVQKCWPNCYAAGHELGWGLRIAAAYGKSLVLYNVPPDTFEQIRHETMVSGPSAPSNHCSPGSGATGLEHGRASTFPEALNERPSAEEERTCLSLEPEPLKRLYFDGVEIGRAEFEIIQVAVRCAGGGLRVWAFGSDTIALVWDLTSSRNEGGRNVRRSWIRRNKTWPSTWESGRKNSLDNSDSDSGFDSYSYLPTLQDEFHMPTGSGEDAHIRFFDKEVQRDGMKASSEELVNNTSKE